MIRDSAKGCRVDTFFKKRVINSKTGGQCIVTSVCIFHVNRPNGHSVPPNPTPIQKFEPWLRCTWSLFTISSHSHDCKIKSIHQLPPWFETPQPMIKIKIVNGCQEASICKYYEIIGFSRHIVNYEFYNMTTLTDRPVCQQKIFRRATKLSHHEF